MAGVKSKPQENPDVIWIAFDPMDLERRTRDRLWYVLRRLGVGFEAVYCD